MGKERSLERKNLFYYFEVLDRNTNETAGRLVDITTEGLMLISEKEFRKDEVFQFKMQLPEDLGNKYFNLDAKSMWCRPAKNKGFLDAGFSLVNASKVDIETIETLTRWFKFGVN